MHAVCYPFSELKEKGSIGYIEEGQYTIEQPEPFNMEQEDLSLTGKHNIYNSLAAGIASDISGIKKENIRKSLSDFPGVEHRLEKVCKVLVCNTSTTQRQLTLMHAGMHLRV